MKKPLADAIRDDREMAPLAARVRPKTLDEIIGQQHLIGPGKPLRRQIEEDRIFSMIFWGPPGSGKTTLAMIMAQETRAEFVRLTAVGSGVADVKRVIEAARQDKSLYRKRTILFIDEVHRFNKAQQDRLLPAVEDGTVILIGATTENPSYEVIPPLRSRTRTFMLKPLTRDELLTVLDRALTGDELLQENQPLLDEGVKEMIARLAGGDARQALNILELSITLAGKNEQGKTIISANNVAGAAQQRANYYDKAGDRHYDTISAFIKSVRGSDPDAAVLWLARMLVAGEDPIFVARRLLILASEDIGNADPMGIVVAASAAKAVEMVGMPEAKIILSQATTYLASAPKSNASCMAIDKAERIIEETGDKLSVPLHLRESSFAAAKDIGYGVGYKYPHSFRGHWIDQDYLPEELLDILLYEPSGIGHEAEILKRLEKIKALREKSRRKAETGEKEKGEKGE